MEIEIEVISNIEQYLPVLKEYDYKEKTQTIYLTHLHDIFNLQEKLKALQLKTTFPPSIIVEDNKLYIYDSYIE